MGQKTRATIVSTGLALAGAPSAYAGMANGWLNDGLDVLFASWPWPFKQRRIPDPVRPAPLNAALPLPAGAKYVQFGNGAGGESMRIAQILSPLFVYSADYSYRNKVSIEPWQGTGALDDDEVINNPASSVGAPRLFKVRADASGDGSSPNTSLFGKWTLLPIPIPDKSYLLAINYFIAPPLIEESVGGVGDNAFPIYPFDRTMEQIVCVKALQYMKRQSEYQTEVQILQSLVIDDRMRAGTIAGTNDRIGLDVGVFKPKSAGPNTSFNW